MTISAAVLITWKAPSDNEYNLRNVVWKHYVTTIESCLVKRSSGKKLLYGQFNKG